MALLIHPHSFLVLSLFLFFSLSLFNIVAPNKCNIQSLKNCTVHMNLLRKPPSLLNFYIFFFIYKIVSCIPLCRGWVLLLHKGMLLLILYKFSLSGIIFCHELNYKQHCGVPFFLNICYIQMGFVRNELFRK